MTSSPVLPRIVAKSVVLGTDFSPASERALPYALAMAQRWHVPLIFAHVVVRPTVAQQPGVPSLKDEGGKQQFRSVALERLARLSSPDAVSSLAHEAVIGSGEVWSGLSQIVRERDAGLLVLGTRGLTGVKKLMMGSTAEDVLRSTPCPVMIVGPNVDLRASTRFERILFATNLGNASLHLLHYAAAIAREDEATLTILHVAPRAADKAGRDELRQRNAARLAALLPSGNELSGRAHLVVEFGTAAEEIVHKAEAEQARLIVLGAHPAGRSSTFLSSTLHYVLSHARCPVLASCGT